LVTLNTKRGNVKALTINRYPRIIIALISW
jgi:hypothetical protein